MSTRILGGIALLAMLVVGTPPAFAVGPIVSIAISPSSVTAAAGSTRIFTVSGVDAAGEPADLTTNSVFTTTDPRGTTKANVLTAGKTGNWVITANYNNLTSSATVTVRPGPVTDLTVNPNSDPERLYNGETLTFSAEAFDAFDNVVTDFTVRWSVEGKIGTIASTGKTSATFTASAAGRGKVIARSADESSSVEVLVEQAPFVSNVNAPSSAGNTNASTSLTPTTNTNAPTLTNESAAAATPPETTDTTKPCTPLQRASWVWFYIGYVVLLVLSVYPIRKSRIAWWWIGPLVLTILALWFYFQYRCYPVYPALPYLIIIAGIVAASWYNWQRTEPNKL